MSTAQPTEPARGEWLNGTMPAMQERVVNIPVVGFIEYCLRGVGQVVFMNSPLTGLFIMVAVWIYDPWFGFAGTLGLIISTLAALALGFDRGAIRAGLYGFNGVLVGLALGTFLALRGTSHYRVDHPDQRVVLGPDGRRSRPCSSDRGECPRSHWPSTSPLCCS